MASNRPPLPIYSHLVTPARRTNTFQGGQRPSNIIKLASSTMSLNGSETPLNKTHLFSPAVNPQSPAGDHLLKYDIRRLRASLERKEEQISWWMEKSKADNEKFEALKAKLDQTNRQHDLTLQCVRSTLDGLTCINRSIHVVFIQEDKENKLYDDEQEELMDDNLEENVSLVLLSRLNHSCLKLSRNLDILLRTPLSTSVPSSIKYSHPVQRHESNASSISKQSAVDDVNESSNVLYEEMIDKLNHDLDSMKTHLADQELRTKNLEDELSECKTAHLSAKINFDNQEKRLQEQLTHKDKQILSLATNEHDVLRQLLDEKTTAFERLNEEYASLQTKYHSEYNRNVDCMIKTDALHEHIRLLSETLAEKEVIEEKLTTQQQQMKKLMTLLVPTTPLLTLNKKSHEKKTFGRKVKRHLRESLSSLVNYK